MIYGYKEKYIFRSRKNALRMRQKRILVYEAADAAAAPHRAVRIVEVAAIIRSFYCFGYAVYSCCSQGPHFQCDCACLNIALIKEEIVRLM